MVTINSIHVTTQQGATWGRVYIQYEIDKELFFIFKNWLKFDEKTYRGKGDLSEESAYTKFSEDKRHVFTNKKDVLKGKADTLELTPKEYKKEYGTPSTILERLLLELYANIGEPIENRTGWLERYTTTEPVTSRIKITKTYAIELTDYDSILLKLEPKQKTLYFFYLRHPEGVARKKINEEIYYAEIAKIYSKVKPNSDADKQKKILANLLAIDRKDFDQTVSKINAHILQKMGQLLAKEYIIDGEKGGNYSIRLSKDMIVFDGTFGLS